VDAQDVLAVVDLLAGAGVMASRLGQPSTAEDRTDTRPLRDRLGVDLLPPCA
jgi:hypothetical protein